MFAFTLSQETLQPESSPVVLERSPNLVECTARSEIKGSGAEEPAPAATVWCRGKARENGFESLTPISPLEAHPTKKESGKRPRSSKGLAKASGMQSGTRTPP